MLTTEEKLNHNKRVIGNIVTAIIESNLADPFRMITDPHYASDNIMMYLESANVAREMMNMPKLYLYTFEEED